MSTPTMSGLYAVYLSKEDINHLFFCMGAGYVSNIITMNDINRIGQRLSKDFVPYATGADGVDPAGGDPPSGDLGSIPSASTGDTT